VNTKIIEYEKVRIDIGTSNGCPVLRFCSTGQRQIDLTASWKSGISKAKN